MYDILKYIVIGAAFLMGLFFALAPEDKLISKEKMPDEEQRKKNVRKTRISGIVIVVCVVLMFMI